MNKNQKFKLCECGAKIRLTSKACYSCANRTRHNKGSEDLVNTRRSLKIGIRGLPEYKLWKERVMGRDFFKCRGCQTTEKLDIHHLYKEYDIIFEEFCEKYKKLLTDKRTMLQLALGWKELWDLKNGCVLCKSCHEKIHRGEIHLENEG